MITVEPVPNPLEPNRDPALVITVPARHVAEFKELVFRGANLWPDSSTEIKKFSDLVTCGKIMQDYDRVDHKLTASPRGNL